MVLRAKRLLSGGLNTDVAASVKATEVYIAGRNLRPYRAVEDGRFSLRKIEGNRLVNSPLFLSDTALVIGQEEDSDNNRVFYLVIDPDVPARNSILVYDGTADEIRVVLSNLNILDRSLAWSTDRYHMIQTALNGPLLYFTDDLGQPYKVNVERGQLTYHPTYTPIEDTDTSLLALNGIRREDLTVIRRQPQFPLIVGKKDSATDIQIPDQINNFIENGAFQFTYRYRYRDGETSVPAIFSAMLTQNNDDAGETYDTITVTFDQRETIPYEVQTIEVMVRYGNIGSFYVIKTFDRSKDNQAMVDHNLPDREAMGFLFYNDSRGVAVADELAYKLFDTVPLLSKAIEVARNRLFLGNNLMDLEQVGINMEFSVGSYTGKGLRGEYIRVYGYCNQPAGGPAGAEETRIFDKVLVRLANGDPDLDGYYVTGLTGTAFQSRSLPFNVNVSAADRLGGLEYDDDFRLEQWMNVEWGGPCYYPHDYRFTVTRTYTGRTPNVYGVENFGGSPFEGAQQLKSDSKYGIGIIFFDFAGRTPGVVIVDDNQVTTPDREYEEPTYNGAVNWQITAGQESNIPVWATHYSIVRTRNLTRSFFIQNLCQAVKYVEYDDDQLYTYVETFDKDTTIGVAWDMSRLFSDKLGYVYQEGDILKAYASDNTSTIRLPIVDQAGQYVITKPEDIGSLASGHIWENSIVEVYTPYRPDEENEFYYEVGLRYDILSPGTGSRSFSQDSGTFPGDTYIKQRDLGTGFLGCEAMNPNDSYFQQWNTDIGRAFLTYDFRRARRRVVSIVWSERWIPGTEINGMSSFNALDEDHVDRNLGSIQALKLAGRGQQEGTVMLAICQVGTASLYLGEQQVYDNTGEAILATSGNVIGTKNILHGDYGTDHPESILEKDRKVFWFDVREGCFVRYAGNQMFPISSYGIDAYAKELASRIGLNSQVKVVSGWNEKEGEYLVTIPEITGWEDELEDFTITIIDLERFAHGDAIYTLQAGSKYKITLYSTDVALYLVDYQDPANYLVDYSSPNPKYLVDWDAGPGALCLKYLGEDILCLDANENGPEKTNLHPSTTAPLILNSLYGRPGIVTIEEYGIGNPHTIFTGDPRTMVFKEDADQWTVPYSFAPEMMGRVNLKLISWVAGKLYVHDDKVNLNQFYGVTYNAEVSILVNEQFSIMKLLKGLVVEGNTAPDWTHCRAELPFIRSSDLELSEWEDREGVYYAAVRKDRLSPNTPGDEVAKLVSGDDMRAQYFKVLFRWGGNDELIFYLADVGMNISHGHTPVIPT